MKQIDVILLWAAAAMLIAIFVLAQLAAAQEEKQSPDKSPATSSRMRLYTRCRTTAGIFGRAPISRGIGAGSGRSWRTGACSSILT